MENKDYDELLRKSLITICKLKKKIEDGNGKKEKIAIIGMACRFPGDSDTPEKFWDLLSEKRNSTIDIPRNRFDITDYYDVVHGKPEKMYVKQENFLTRDISEFDGKFFGISNVEANEMDPQQRFLYEVSWEALENAGLDVQELRGSNTGVFLGISSVVEYSKLPRDVSKVNQYTGTGTTTSIASGRLSYTFGWNGPSISLDTACSSSLVSTHLAVNSLAKKECDLAISAGVSLMISPEVMSSLCAMNALSEDGRSKPFDETANGYGRGEGCGVVVLKRLSDALRDNDIVYAVIEGSAINNDGESSGLTVPNGRAQKQVILDAIKNAGVSPDDIDYIETHGTGTMLGDPIEIDAIKDIFLSPENKRASDLKIGAVKGNIGHLESAAGIAGLIKVALCLYNKKMVPIANLHKLNPMIRTDSLPVAFLTEGEDWEKNNDKRRMAGLSSFGFSGTNAHMVISEGVKTIETSAVMPHYLLHLSAKTEKGVVEIVEEYQKLFEGKEDINISEVCYTGNTCRDKFAHCAVITGKDRQDFRDGFDKLISLYQKTGTIYLIQTQLTGSSEGEDRLDAKRKIYKQIDEHVFTACVDKMIQPKFVFVFQSYGNKILEAAKELYNRLPVFKDKLDFYLEKISEKEINERFLEYKEGDVGAASDLFLMALYVALAEMFYDMGVYCEIACGCKAGDYTAAVISKIMSFDTAVDCIRSRYMENAEIELDQSNIHRPASRYISSTTSSTLREVKDLYTHFSGNSYEKKAAYGETVKELYHQGYRFFLEFGQNEEQIQHILNQEDIITVKVLNEKEALMGLLLVIARCISFGSKIKWNRFYEGQMINKMVLPNYPFEKMKHWVTSVPNNNESFVGLPKTTEKFDAKEVVLPFESIQYKFIFSNSNFQEVLDNSGVIHMGYYLEMIQNVIEKSYPNKEYIIEDMEFMSAIMLMEEEVKEVLIVLEKEENNLIFKIFNKNTDQRNWNQNMRGSIAFGSAGQEKIYNLEQIRKACREKELDEAAFYEPLEKEKGFYFGHAVRWIESACCSEKAAYIQFRCMDEYDTVFNYNLGLHPGILDACAQACNFISISHTPREKKYMVNRMKQVKVYPQHYTDDTLSAHVIFQGFDEKRGEVKAGILVFNAIGEVVVKVGVISLKEFDEKQLGMIKVMMENTCRGAGRNNGFLMQFMQASVEKKKELLTQYVVAVMSEVLEENKDDFDIYEPMDTLGLDSMSGLDFYNKITEQLGVEMPFSQLAQCKNLADSAEKIFYKLQGQAEETEIFDKEGEKDFSPEHWIYNYKENRNVKSRIFCFPNGFRSADMFESWQTQLGDDIQVCAIQIPGMDMSRISERAPVYVDEFTQTLIQVLDSEKLLDVPCTSFGHSWGSLFSYRLGYYLNKREDVNYLKLFVSGFTSPAIKNSSVVKILDEIKNQGFHNIPIYEDIKNDKETVDLLVKSYQKVWDYEEMGTRAVLSLLLSACVLIDRYEFNPEDKLTVPIVGFHGIDDYLVDINEMNLWENLATDSFKLYTMKGDHQFVNENQSEKQLIETIKEEIIKMH